MQVKNIVSLALFSGLAACATLPSSGPTGKQIVKSAEAPDTGVPINLVDVRTLADVPKLAQDTSLATLLPDLATTPTDMVGPGDILDINIYEAGVMLFAGNASTAGVGQSGNTPGVQLQKLPPERVDDMGNISIPYAGTLHVAGLTTRQVEVAIGRALHNLSQNPHVLVTLSETINNAVIIGGEVAKPGRLVLQTNRESLSDVVALAGGYRGNARDLTLRVMRGNTGADVRLNDLIENPVLDVRARPGDRLMLINNPESYSILGASGRVEQMPFSRSSVSLAEAVAAAGGVNPSLGDPAAIFLFRYERSDQGQDLPKVYHLNMMQTGAYFLAQKIKMRDKDILYFGNAAANQPSKLIQLISQLFAPILTVTNGVSVVQNSRN